MNLLRLIRKSIYSPAFYRELLAKPFSFSIKYFFSFVLAIALALTVALSFSFIPRVRKLTDDSRTWLLRSFPQELVIRIQNGKASANVEQPYAFPLAKEFEWLSKESKADVENLFVVDAERSFETTRFDEYKTFVLLTEDSVAYREDKGSVKVRSLKGIASTTIDWAAAQSWAGVIERIGRWIVPMIVFGLFVLFFVVFSFLLSYFLVVALLVWLVGKLRKAEFGYRKAYQLTLHAATLAMLYTALAWAGLLPRVRFLFSALVVIVALVNLAQIERKAEPEEQTPSAPTR